MITNKGNDIIAKYLLGQAPEYAAYISVGIGALPLASAQSDTSQQTKKSMDFEAFRVPVTSRGIVNDTITKSISRVSTSLGDSTFTTRTSHGINVGDTVTVIVNQIATDVLVTAATSNTFTGTTGFSSGVLLPTNSTVTYVKDRLIFKAQLPPDHKYQMTEIALYPAMNNQLAIGHDSRTLASFSITEPWFIFGSSSALEYQSSSITDINGNIVPFPNSAKFIDIDNISFSASQTRRARYEQPRFLDRCLMVAGNLSSFTNDSLSLVTGDYISNSNFVADLSKYSGSDVIKFAVSVVSKDETTVNVPYKARVRIDLVDVDNKIASYRKTLYGTDIGASRYVVLSSTLASLETPDTTFNWGKINSMNIYIETLNSGATWDNSYVILDGIRIDNENITNPLYGMVAYSRLKNSTVDAMPIEKVENSQGYIEYRLGVSIF